MVGRPARTGTVASSDSKLSVRDRRLARAAVRFVASLVGLLCSTPTRPAEPPPLCSSASYTVSWCEKPCTYWPDPKSEGCRRKQSFWCASGQPRSDVLCAYEYCYLGVGCNYPARSSQATSCAPDMSPTEKCGDDVDNNRDGCIDEGCPYGDDGCSCVRSCSAPLTCSPPQVAKCEGNRRPELCDNEKDDNCNGLADEGCALPKSNRAGAPGGNEIACRDSLGKDPILLGSRAAVTEPFADFTAASNSTLAFTRTYNSSALGWFRFVETHIEPPVFGAGWHHDWEGTLTCSSEVCRVKLGAGETLRFQGQGTLVPSLDGTEHIEVHRPWSYLGPNAGEEQQHNLLVRRQSGQWVLYLSDGREITFATTCEPCGLGPEYCRDPAQAGKARIAKVVDRLGRSVYVDYDRSSGVLIRLRDELGHSLELRSNGSCTDRLARELRYDGATVGSYEYDDRGHLISALDSTGIPLRTYEYTQKSGGSLGQLWLLQTVRNEAGDAIGEFRYEQSASIGFSSGLGDVGMIVWWATRVVDPESTIDAYWDGSRVEVTERFGSTQATSVRELDDQGLVTRISGDCSSCGSEATFTYENRRPKCVVDALGHVTYTQRDARGYPTYQVEYAGAACPPPAALPAPSRERWWVQGLTKPVAQGVSLVLDRQISESRRSTAYQSVYENASTRPSESDDYDPAPKA